MLRQSCQGPVVINVTKFFVAKNATKLENVTNLGKLHLNVIIDKNPTNLENVTNFKKVAPGGPGRGPP